MEFKGKGLDGLIVRRVLLLGNAVQERLSFFLLVLIGKLNILNFGKEIGFWLFLQSIVILHPVFGMLQIKYLHGTVLLQTAVLSESDARNVRSQTVLVFSLQIRNEESVIFF